MHLVDGGQRLEAAVWGEEKGGKGLTWWPSTLQHFTALPLVCLGIAFIFARLVTEESIFCSLMEIVSKSTFVLIFLHPVFESPSENQGSSSDSLLSIYFISLH